MGILSLMKKSISFIFSTSGKKKYLVLIRKQYQCARVQSLSRFTNKGLDEKNNISLMNCLCNTESIHVTVSNMKELGYLKLKTVCKYVYLLKKTITKNEWEIKWLPFTAEI